MTFLNPLNLWFLIFLSLPIVLHLLNRFKNKEEDFSSLVLIKELKTTSLKRIQFKQLLLLLLRLLGIIFLVFSFSQPVTNGFIPSWASSEKETRLFIILDNSASMSAKSDKKSFLEQSKHGIMSLIPIFEKNSLISIFKTCPPEKVFEGFSNDPQLKEVLKSVKQTYSFDDVWNNTANFINSNKINEKLKECVIFSDLMYLPDSSFIKSINDYENWKFYLIQPDPINDNMSIQSVRFENRINTLQQLTKVNTQIKNNSNSLKKNIPVELLFNKQRVGQVISEFSPGIEKEFQFKAYPLDEGVLHGEITIPNDDYIYDNSWFHTIPVLKQISCAIIGKNSSEIKLLEMVLNSIDPENLFLKTESRIQPNLNRLFLDEFDMVIIYNSSVLSKKSIEDLDAFTKEGGGVLWFQGEKADFSDSRQIGGILDFPINTKIVESGQGFFSTKIDSVESSIFKEIKVKNINNEMPKVYKYIKSIPNNGHKIHLSLNNNDPLLIEFTNGSGKIFYFTSLLDITWNDLPIRGIIIPLIYRLIILAGTDEFNTASVEIDQSKIISIQESKLRDKWEVISPSGQKEMLVPDYNIKGIQIRMTNELGIYQVYANGEHVTSFPTKLNKKELIKNRINNIDIEPIIPSKYVKLIKLDKNINSSFSETRSGKSLWKIFLYLAIFVFFIESIIGLPNEKAIKRI